MLADHLSATTALVRIFLEITIKTYFDATGLSKLEEDGKNNLKKFIKTFLKHKHEKKDIDDARWRTALKAINSETHNAFFDEMDKIIPNPHFWLGENNLRKLIRIALKDVLASGDIDKDQYNAAKSTLIDGSPPSTFFDEMNMAIHNPHFWPEPDSLKANWKKLEPALQALHNRIAKPLDRKAQLLLSVPVLSLLKFLLLSFRSFLPADTPPPPSRRRNMAKIGSVGTTPEKKVCAIVRKMGYRFLRHNRQIPGTPDLTFPGTKKVVFVHGCFWHRHNCKKGRSMPAVRVKFWRAKFRENVERDTRTMKSLKRKAGKPWCFGSAKPKRKPPREYGVFWLPNPYPVSTRAAQNLNSGILPTGSRASLVSRLAAASS